MSSIPGLLSSPHLTLRGCLPTVCLPHKNIFHHGHHGEFSLEQRHQCIHCQVYMSLSDSNKVSKVCVCVSGLTVLEEDCTVRLGSWTESPSVLKSCSSGILIALVVFSLKAPTVTRISSLLPAMIWDPSLKDSNKLLFCEVFKHNLKACRDQFTTYL